MDHDSGIVSGHSESPAAGTPTSIDEINAAPEPTNTLHESVEDILADDSTHPEGVKTEHADPAEVEPNADVHEPQADGNPDEASDDTSIEGEIESSEKTGGA